MEAPAGTSSRSATAVVGIALRRDRVDRDAGKRQSRVAMEGLEVLLERGAELLYLCLGKIPDDSRDGTGDLRHEIPRFIERAVGPVDRHLLDRDVFEACSTEHRA